MGPFGWVINGFGVERGTKILLRGWNFEASVHDICFLSVDGYISYISSNRPLRVDENDPQVGLYFMKQGPIKLSMHPFF